MAEDNTDPNKNSSSAYQLVDTFIPALAVAAVYVVIFLILRRSKRRFYAPRTYLGSLREQYVPQFSYTFTFTCICIYTDITTESAHLRYPLECSTGLEPSSRSPIHMLCSINPSMHTSSFASYECVL